MLSLSLAVPSPSSFRSGRKKKDIGNMRIENCPWGCPGRGRSGGATGHSPPSSPGIRAGPLVTGTFMMREGLPDTEACGLWLFSPGLPGSKAGRPPIPSQLEMGGKSSHISLWWSRGLSGELVFPLLSCVFLGESLLRGPRWIVAAFLSKGNG